MPSKAIITCLSPGLKEILDRESEHIAKPSDRKTFQDLLKAAPDCEDGAMIGVELEGKRAKRAPSSYNLFIGECIKGRGGTMSSCALEWKEKNRK